jgi:hypothetical protein
MVLPGMSDGRAFTSYKSDCQYNHELMKNIHVHDNNMYRKYLQDNAETILNTLKEHHTPK